MADKPASRFPFLFTLICMIIALAVGLFIFRPWEMTSNTVETPTNVQVVTGESPPSSNLNPDLSLSKSGLSKAQAVIITTKGKIAFKFYPKDAPETVARIIELINQKFYNGLTFHRVNPGFIIQTGDPTGTGHGGSGRTIKAEFNGRAHQNGAVGLARGRNPDSGDSQFYITLDQQPSLNGRYTVFGLVVEGHEVAKKIERGDRIKWIYIE